MEVQPQLVLLQKTLLNIEGLGRQLDPQLDLWQTAKPFLDRWMDEQMGVRAMVRGFRKNLPTLAEKLPEFPELFYSVIKQADKGESKVRLSSHDLKAIKDEIDHANRRTVLAILTGALLIFIGLLFSP